MSTEDTQIYYFGDSLTDVSVIFDALVDALTAQILPGLIAALGPNPTPQQIAAAQQQAAFLATQQAAVEVTPFGFGPENAVTNEFTHAVYTGDVGGATVENFANAGARALGVQEPFGPGTGYDANLGGQLARFATATGGTVDADSKAVLFIGSNDFSDAFGGALEAPNASFLNLIGAATQTTDALLSQLEAAARSLDDAGIETIYFGTLPAGTFFPGSDALDALSAGLSDLAISVYNALLTATAASLQDDGIDVQIIDYAAVATAISNDPSGFGIVAERSDFLVDGSTFDSDQVGFWDPIHPAEAVHQAWGAYADFVMQGGSTSALSDFGTLNFQTNGDNAVFANGGNDTVFSLRGDDIVFGGTGGDIIVAGRGDDIASGGADDDLLRGQSGNDILDGGSGDDTVFGASGNDVLIDGLGDDVVRGGSGDDVFVFVEGVLEGDASASQDDFRGGSGDDTLYLVLDDAAFADFEANGAASTLTTLGISIASIETIVAIKGRAQVESVLGGLDWFQDGDFWGLLPAPTPESTV